MDQLKATTGKVIKPTIGNLIDTRDNGIGILRLLLSLAVVYSHAYTNGGFSYQFEVIHWLSRGQENFGHLAVKGFMVLSGLLVAQSFYRHSFREYLTRRVLRIFPGYFVCLVLTAFLLGPLVTWLAGDSLANYFAWGGEKSPYTYLTKNFWLQPNQPGIRNLFPQQPVINGSLWTLYHEFKGYIAIAILGFLGWLVDRRLLIITWGLFYVINLGEFYWPSSTRFLSDFFIPINIWFDGTVVIQLPLYLLGGLLLYAYRQEIIVNRKGTLLALTLLGICWFLPLYHWLAPGILPYLFLVAARWLPSSLPLLRGDLSYGFYIYSFPIQQLLAFLGVNKQGLLPYLFLTLLLVLPLAIASWSLIEKPALRWTKLIVSETSLEKPFKT